MPEGLALARGQAVWVPFGRESRLAQGVVFGFTDEPPPVPQVKLVDSPVDGRPVLTSVQCDLALWLSEHYAAPLYECAVLMMPPGSRQRVRTALHLVPRPLDDAVLAPRAARLVEYLRSCGGSADLRALGRALGPAAERAADALVREGYAIRVSQFEPPRAGPRFQRRLRLTAAGRAADPDAGVWRRRPRQRAALQALHRAGGELPEAELRRLSGAGPQSLAALVAGGIVDASQERVLRDPLAGRSFQTGFAPTLSHAQEAACRRLGAAIAGAAAGKGTPPVFLLHGITGSGKTEVYLQAVRSCVARGRRAIALVPEIALEPQTVARFSARFPGRVAVLHSGLTAGEAYDEWWRIRDGEFDVVVGPRSALFAPQPDLGLIVVDEEHEASYKQQDPAPRYHARSVAQELARRSGAVLLLGSATPDLESYLRARNGRYQLLQLSERIEAHRRAGDPHPTQPGGTGGSPVAPSPAARGPLPVSPDAAQPPSAVPPVAPSSPDARRPSLVAPDNSSGLPHVEVVDLREELKAGNRSIFSRSLQSALGLALSREQQAILFLNRRGSATFVQCRDCGAVARCARCDTPLTYHGAAERLLCHQCSAGRRLPRRCRACSSARIRFMGAGTERVQQEVRALFPGARVLRWDRDAARVRSEHEELLRQFAGHEADVLVGTQMIAKGLDLPRVTLVGVVNADVNLYLPDFRAAERTFQLLTQVAGRAGRGSWPGAVIVQTYSPDHYAITAAARQDYALFARQELAFRHQHGYPPYDPLVRLVYSDLDPARAESEAQSYGRALGVLRARRGMSDVSVLGPVPAYFRRVRGRHRWQIVLKGAGGRALLDQLPPPRGWIIDVDPLHML